MDPHLQWAPGRCLVSLEWSSPPGFGRGPPGSFRRFRSLGRLGPVWTASSSPKQLQVHRGIDLAVPWHLQKRYSSQ